MDHAAERLQPKRDAIKQVPDRDTRLTRAFPYFVAMCLVIWLCGFIYVGDFTFSKLVELLCLVFVVCFAILGVLGLVGMNIKNAVVLVDQIDLEQKAGRAPVDAVVAATKSRIVPVTMASGTTILGMLPLLPDAMFGGMAATIMGGLLVATFLTILVLPVAYCLIMRIKSAERNEN